MPFWLVGLSAVLSALAHPPLSWWWLILIAPAPLLGVLSGKPMRVGFGIGWWWGFTYGLLVGFPLTYLINLQTGSFWLTMAGWVAVAGLSALFWGLFGVVASRMPQNTWLGWLGVAAAWTLCQWLRGLGPFAFVWGHFAVALYRVPPLLQIADIVGTWGVEFLIALWNTLLGALLLAIFRNDASHAPSPVAFWWVCLALGYSIGRGWSIGAIKGETVSVTIVQPNVDLARAYSPSEWVPIRQQIAELVQQAHKGDPDLIVLPESLEPYPMPDSREAFEFWQQLAESGRVNLLVGGYRIGDPMTRQYTNTAHLFAATGKWQYHDKVQLVPLGEAVPLRDYLPFLRAFGVVERDLLPGRSLKPLEVDPMRIGVVICMESTYPWIARGLVREGANMLVVLSNESWFGRTAALEQHLAFCVLRAIETRRYVVRCAPQGISAIIKPDGKIVRLPPFERVINQQEITLQTELTPYVRWGDWIVGVSGVLVALGWLMGARRRAWGVFDDRPAAT
jgi:apolipoprotein N-acyltransferase